MKGLLGAVTILQFANSVSGFTTSSSLARLPVHQWNDATLPSLRTTGSDDIPDNNHTPSEDDSNSNSSAGQEMTRKMKPTSARIGGRRKKPRPTAEVPSKADNPRNESTFLSKFRTPALIVLLLLLVRGFFGGDETSDYYYSYSSTVYETRTYSSGGEVKTSRSESRSFKSNIPGMEQDANLDNMAGDDLDDIYYDESDVYFRWK